MYYPYNAAYPNSTAMPSPWSGFRPPYWIHDQLLLGGTTVLFPQTIIQNIAASRAPIMQSSRLCKCGGSYSATLRNGRNVDIGVCNASNTFIVNPHADRTFDCFLCDIQLEGMDHKEQMVVPFKPFKRRNISPYFPLFRRNFDCPLPYYTEAFFSEIQNGGNIRFLTLPPHDGWNQMEGQWVFAHSGETIPVLTDYYDPGILTRELIDTDQTPEEAAAELRKCIPEGTLWPQLLNYSTSSVLLPYYAARGYKPDLVLITQPGSELNAKTATVLLHNRDFHSTPTNPLTECKTKLQSVLNSSHDCTVVFRHSAYIEEHKKVATGMGVLLEDLSRGQGIAETSRHLIAVISNRPGTFSAETSSLYVDLSGCSGCNDLPLLQEKVGKFLSALIKHIIPGTAAQDLVDWALAESSSNNRSEETGTRRILTANAKILQKYGLMSNDNQNSENILQLSDLDDVMNAEFDIANEFIATLSDNILKKRFDIVNQTGSPYYDRNTIMAVYDGTYVNLPTSAMNLNVADLHSTQKRNVVLSALTAAGKLHSTNNYKRALDVVMSPSVTETISFYSIPASCLTAPCQDMLEEIGYADYLFDTGTQPENFFPIMMTKSGLVAGRVIDDRTDEAESLYFCGQTRSGKTYLIAQTAVMRAVAGFKCVIFDQSGAFSLEELKKHLPEVIISDLFTFWDLGSQGLPVGVLSLEGCHSPKDKKDRLAGILAVLAQLTGDIQLQTLRSRLKDIADAVEAEQIHSLTETLRFFDEEDPGQAEIKKRLAETSDDLEGLPVSNKTWGGFLESANKIVVVSTAADNVRKSHLHLDALMSSLFSWKQHHRQERMMIALDELTDLCLDQDGPISIILRKGGKHRLSMLLASQKCSTQNGNLDTLISNCGLVAMFKYDGADIDIAAKRLGCTPQQLASLEDHQFVIKGGFFNRHTNKHTTATLKGVAYSAAKYLHLEPETDEIETKAEPSETPSDYQDLPTERQELPECDETEPDEPAPEPLFLPSEQSLSPDTEGDIPEDSLSEAPEPTPIETELPEPEIAETEAQPAPPESEPDAPEEDPQALIELELQQKFRSLMRSFSPDYPNWTGYLAELFDQIAEQHHIADSDDRDKLRNRLEGFMWISPGCMDYRERLETLYRDIWPSD